MRALAPEPVRVLLPGTVYRNEQITGRSAIQFNQVEVLAVGTNITMADLKGVLEEFVHQFFGPGRRMVLRGSYFPFTEPSAEVDMKMKIKGRYQWVELGGCGMVDPNVLKAVGYDPEEVTGLAFGLGVERICMRQHGITDIRALYENDVRFLHQF